MTLRRQIISVLGCLFVGGGGPAAAQAASAPPRIAKTPAPWQKSMSQLGVPQPGCSTGTSPQIAWKRVACVAPPNLPYLPQQGPRPFTVGGLNDFSAEVA